MLKYDARIIIVDDSRAVRLALVRLFQSLGYHNIVEASDGAEAIRLHAQERADLIMLDIVMPVMRGDEALAHIRETDGTTPIIMLASRANESDFDVCRDYGITDFFPKAVVATNGSALLAQHLARLS
jgi:CheY-like chemotaxis protein